jgi:hypothetical protein
MEMTETHDLVDMTVERYLAYPLQLPVRPAWSRTQIAKYLKEQKMLGSRKATISEWEAKLCYYVKDFRDRIPKDEHGKPIPGFAYSQYQFSVVCRLSFLMTSMRPYLNGTDYLATIRQTIKNREIQRRYLSYAVWQYDQSNVA